ncbi:MAG: NUDIX domain-containing protein [Planctomycetota bacterium]
MPHTPANAEQRTELIARGLAVYQGRALICFARDAGFGYLPGGRIEHGEPAESALIREFAEETGLTVRVGPLLLVGENSFLNGNRSIHEVSLVFHVEPESGDWPDSPPTIEDHIEFRWIDLAAVVDLDIRPPTAKAWLASGAPGPSGGQSGPLWVSDLADTNRI